MDRHEEIMYLLDNLRLHNITGSQEFVISAEHHIENLIWLDESDIKILVMNGFEVKHNYVCTKKGCIALP